MASPASPIADLTYRSYDGPLAPPVYRWWPIAKMTMRLSIKKKSFWVLGVLGAWWYLIVSIVLYFFDTFITNPTAQKQFFQRVIWKDQFLDAFAHSQLFLMLIALLIGVGAIANDNQANALLVYLSKPCNKLDYLAGKWVGLFLLFAGVVAGPTLLMFGYWALTYRQYGVLSDDPWLILRLLAFIPIAPAFYASLSLGISSLFNQGWKAGAVLAGIYFLSWIFTTFDGVAIVVTRNYGRLTTNLFYASIDGIQIAFAKMFLGTRGSVLFSKPGASPLTPGIPNLWLYIGIYLAVCVGSLLIAWKRIRAVEVVGR